MEISSYILKRVMVTATVYSRLFEVLNSLTIGAVHRNHIGSAAFLTIAKKGKTRCPRAISNV